MPVVDVLNQDGEKISEVTLPEEIFDIPAKSSVLHEIVTMQLARRRSAGASVKRRSDIRGSRRKLFRQKGTGRARRGDIKSGLLRGGGVIFGPTPRSFDFSPPKKVRRLALKMALSEKVRENRLIILDRLEMERIKTKDFIAVMQALKGQNALVVIEEKNERVELSARNIPGVKVLRAEGINVYDILKYETLILVQDVLSTIERRLAA